MRYVIITISISFFANFLTAQEKKPGRNSSVVDFSATIGTAQQTMAVSYIHNWKVGKKEKIEIGLGFRNTAYFGIKKDFWTAPASVARSSSIPFLVVVSGQKTQNWDTLTVQRPFTNSFNVTGNIGYHLSSRWFAGFNIDLIGFTIGRTGTAIFTSNGATTTEPSAKPAPFNLLLTGDLDIGSLNSEFYLYYKLNKHWSLKGLYQFIFIEYKTTTLKQTTSDGTQVDRFRNKANNGGIGVAYHF